MKKVLRPPQAKNESTSRVAPEADSGLEAVTPTAHDFQQVVSRFKEIEFEILSSRVKDFHAWLVKPATPTPIAAPLHASATRTDNANTVSEAPAGVSLPVSHYASAVLATTKAASRPEKQTHATLTAA